MPTQDAVLSALQKAVELSADSAPLRRHYAEMLLNRGLAKEAEGHFRRAVELDDDDPEAKLGLARSLQSQHQHAAALFLVKQVIRGSRRPARAYVLYARLLLELGSVERAVTEYRKAVHEDPEIQDPDLESRLGLELARDEDDGPATADLRVPSPDTAEIQILVESAPIPELPEMPAPERPVGFTEALRELFSERTRLTFQDVGGLESIKEEIRTILLHPLNNRDYYRAYEKPVGGRLLLYGPPGCGKTHLARAIAGEVLAPFLGVRLDDVMEVWKGESPRVVREIFQQARQQNPWVLLFDEVQEVGSGRAVTQELLKEMAADAATNDGLLILVATNAPWDADPALLHADRFDRVLFLAPPAEGDRVEILQVLCRSRPQHHLDFAVVATETEGFTSDDLRRLVNRAVETNLQLSLEEGRLSPLTTEDLLREAEKVSVVQSQEWLAVAREYLAKPPEAGDIYGDLRRYLALRG
jgi:AAA+ superfamily predicted ATPase